MAPFLHSDFDTPRANSGAGPSPSGRRRTQALFLIWAGTALLIFFVGLVVYSYSVTSSDDVAIAGDFLLPYVGGALGAGMSILISRFAFQREPRSGNSQTLLNATYASALQRLSDENQFVRLGSVYTLKAVAEDSPSTAPAVIAVLTSFVRSRVRVDERHYVEQPVDIQGAISAIGQIRPFARSIAVNFESLDLSGYDLSGGDYSGVDFSRSIFHGSDLSRALLAGANLTFAIGTDTNFSSADLRNSVLDGASFSGANLANANFAGALLTHADLSYAIAVGANFSHAFLAEANLYGSDLSYADFSEAFVRETNFELARTIGTTCLDSDRILSSSTGTATTPKVDLDPSEPGKPSRTDPW